VDKILYVDLMNETTVVTNTINYTFYPFCGWIGEIFIPMSSFLM